MNNPVLSTFQQASFRGVPFLFIANDQSGGRKYKIFEYPNQDTRFTEDLGKLQRTYKMTATIADSTFEYKNSKQRLIDALEEPGKGILVHPTDGIKEVFALPYKVNESITHTGTAEFQLTFVETGPQLFPQNAPSNAAVILQNLDNFINLINTDVSNFWGALATFQGNIEYSANLILGLGMLFQNAGTLVTNNVNAYSSYITSLESLNDNAYRYPTEANAYSNNVQDLFNFAGQLSTDNTGALIIFNSFFGYESALPFESITLGTDEREKNRLITTQLVNAQSLVYYYLTVANTQFETEEEIEVQHKLLNQQFINVILNNLFTDLLGNTSPVLSDDTLRLLETLRFNAHESLNRQLTTARRIVDITVKNDSLLSLVFNYYGDIDFYDTIFNLNNLTDATNLSGQLKVLTDEDSR